MSNVLIVLDSSGSMANVRKYLPVVLNELRQTHVHETVHYAVAEAGILTFLGWESPSVDRVMELWSAQPHGGSPFAGLASIIHNLGRGWDCVYYVSDGDYLPSGVSPVNWRMIDLSDRFKRPRPAEQPTLYFVEESEDGAPAPPAAPSPYKELVDLGKRFVDLVERAIDRSD